MNKYFEQLKGYRTYITLSVAFVAAVLKVAGFMADDQLVTTILEWVIITALPLAGHFRRKA